MNARTDFRAIDLYADRTVLLRFAHDLFRTSFPEPEWFERRFGDDGEGYVDWLRAVTGGDPRLASLLQAGDEPIGMFVLGPEPDEPDTGHVYHYYLAPGVRGRGLGRTLDDQATATLAERGFTMARLHVAPSNVAAIAFYERLRWRGGNPVAGKGVIAMTKGLRR